MESRIDIWLRRAESVWLEPLRSLARQQFSNTWLPSHDHTHHQRVWNLCKRLIREMDRCGIPADYPLVEGIMVAAWFHDLGMAQTTGERHGHLGRELCMKFLRDHPAGTPGRIDEILGAIEHHDVKEGAIPAGMTKEKPPGILPVLSAADDLDALGAIGIYRYTEIYLMRGIVPESLGESVLRNVHHRLRNLAGCRVCMNLPGLVEEQGKELVEFFEDYEEQVRLSGPVSRLAHGPAGVVNQVRSGIMDRRVPPEKMADHLPEEGTDPYVRNYFNRLQNELYRARN